MPAEVLRFPHEYASIDPGIAQESVRFAAADRFPLHGRLYLPPRGETDTARLEIENISAALDFYRLDLGVYPSQEQGLAALIEAPADAPGWRGPYIKKAAAIDDPWQRAYRYLIPGEHGEFDLFTLGADDAPGGEDEDQDVGDR